MGNERIMVVEDESIVAMGIKYKLRGFRLQCCWY